MKLHSTVLCLLLVGLGLAKTTSAVNFYTRTEVARHNVREDAWMIVHDQVYDLTSFLNEHPGGEEVLLEFAGLDASDAFDDVGHSSAATSVMQRLKLGEVVEEGSVKFEETIGGK